MPTEHLFQLKELLDSKVELYERPDFIAPDPISVPHRFSRRQDIEVAGLLTATIAWGNRKAIVAKAHQMLDRLGAEPFDFVMSASPAQIDSLASFVYRTFQKDDLPSMVRGLRSAYQSSQNLSLEDVFAPRQGETLRDSIARFRALMAPAMAQRSLKHIADTRRGAAAKRICMFLRWMVRPSARGVDFGLWDKILPSQLVIPLDVHSGRTARTLGLLSRKQDDWLAAAQLTDKLRLFAPADPVRYDFALFSIGIVEGGVGGAPLVP